MASCLPNCSCESLLNLSCSTVPKKSSSFGLKFRAPWFENLLPNLPSPIWTDVDSSQSGKMLLQAIVVSAEEKACSLRAAPSSSACQGNFQTASDLETAQRMLSSPYILQTYPCFATRRPTYGATRRPTHGAEAGPRGHGSRRPTRAYVQALQTVMQRRSNQCTAAERIASREPICCINNLQALLDARA